MDGESSDASFMERARTLGWNTGSDLESPHSSCERNLQQSPFEACKKANCTERQHNKVPAVESRRTTKKVQHAAHKIKQVDQSSTDDSSMLMDDYVFLNATHAAVAGRAKITSKIPGQPPTNMYKKSSFSTQHVPSQMSHSDEEDIESRHTQTLECVNGDVGINVGACDGDIGHTNVNSASKQCRPHMQVSAMEHHGEKRMYKKSMYTMAGYDRKALLASSVQHSKPTTSSKKVQSNAANFSGESLSKQQVYPSSDDVQSGGVKNKPDKRVHSPASVMHHWFSKLIGKSPKEVKRLTEASSGGNVRGPTQASPNDILRKQGGIAHKEGESTKAPLTPAKVLVTTSRSSSTNPSVGGGFERSERSDKGCSRRRSISDKASNRFCTGTRSERWTHLRLNQLQPQPKQENSSPLDKYRSSISNGNKVPISTSHRRVSVLPESLVDAHSSKSSLKHGRHVMQDEEPEVEMSTSKSRFISVSRYKTETVESCSDVNGISCNKTLDRSVSFSSEHEKQCDKKNLKDQSGKGTNVAVSASRSTMSSYGIRSQKYPVSVTGRNTTNDNQPSLIEGRGLLPSKMIVNHRLSISKSAGPATPNQPRKLSSAKNHSLSDTCSDTDSCGHQWQHHHCVAAPPPDRDIEVLNEFLNSQHQHCINCINGDIKSPRRLHVILSNSGISSMISAVCYAWILQKTRSMLDGWERVPVMSIPRRSMWSCKQLAWLFQQAGLDTHALLFNNEVDFEAFSEVCDCKVSIIGQDIVNAEAKAGSYCTIVAEKFFKEINPSIQPKCIRILLIAGLLVDTENLDFSNTCCTRRDEIAATLLLPGAGHRGRSMLLDELKQNHDDPEFDIMMIENYGVEHPDVKKAETHIKHEIDLKPQYNLRPRIDTVVDKRRTHRNQS